MVDVAVIGCGVIGAAVAMELAKRQVSVVVLEKNNDVAMGTTKANSAILHAGYDPEPGTLMARLNVRGVELAKEICENLDVHRKQIGSLVLAFTDEEVPHVEKLYENAKANGVPGAKIISGEEVAQMEPNLSPVKCALYAPSAAIVNPWEFAIAMAENAVENGAEVRLNSPVTEIEKTENGWLLKTPSGDVEAKYVVNAAGVSAGEVHEMVAEKEFTTIPCRGEYYLLDKTEGTRVNHVIFQCPTKVGKGVLVSPTVHGNLIVGPNAEDVDSVANTAAGLAFVAEMAKKSVPSINFRENIRNFAGVRANTDQSDFIIEMAADGFLDLAGMKSPGLSAAAAVGEEAVKLLEEAGLSAPKKENPVTKRHKVRFKELSAEEKAELVKKNPAYGRVICRCETITEGEIIDACHEIIPPCSIDGVKRRAGSGMGRCQGGFCGPRVLEILARELKKDPEEIMQDGAGTVILTGRTKEGGER